MFKQLHIEINQVVGNYHPNDMNNQLLIVILLIQPISEAKRTVPKKQY